MMFGNTAVIIWLGHGLRKGHKLFYSLSLAYLAFNMVLTITDDFGIADLLYLVFIGMLLIVLLLSKRKFT